MTAGGTWRFAVGWLAGAALTLTGVLAVHDALYLAGLVVLALTTMGFAGGAALARHSRGVRVGVCCGGPALLAVGVAVPMLWPAPSHDVTELAGADLGTDPMVFTPVPGTTEGVLRTGVEPRSLDTATGALGDPRSLPSTRWVIAPDGDGVSLLGDELVRVGRDGDRTETRLDLAAPDGRRTGRSEPQLVAVTDETVVVGACTLDGACRLQGIGSDGEPTWTTRTEWTGYVQSVALRRGRAPSQVVTNPQEGPRSVIDADTGEELASVPQEEDSQFMVVDDLLVLRTGEGRTCRYTVRRGAEIVLDAEASCDGTVHDAARRGQRIWPTRWDESREQLVLDLTEATVRTVEASVPDVATLAGWDANVVEDGGRLGLVDRITGAQRWSRDLGEHEVLGTSTDVVVVKVSGGERLLSRDGDRLLVLDAADGSTVGELRVPTDSVQARDDRQGGAGGVVGLPGAALVLWEDEDGERAAIVGDPREATTSDAPLDGYSRP